MALPPYEPGPKESNASLALTLAIGAFAIGTASFLLAIPIFGMGIVLIGPMIGVAMLVSAGFCVYWLARGDQKEAETSTTRLAAIALTSLLALAGLAAFAFIAAGGGGIYK